MYSIVEIRNRQTLISFMLSKFWSSAFFPIVLNSSLPQLLWDRPGSFFLLVQVSTFVKYNLVLQRVSKFQIFRNIDVSVQVLYHLWKSTWLLLVCFLSLQWLQNNCLLLFCMFISLLKEKIPEDMSDTLSFHLCVFTYCNASRILETLNIYWIREGEFISGK